MHLKMRFSPAVNPETGLEPSGTVETTRATAYLAERQPGVWSHDGATDVDWDTQQVKRDSAVWTVRVFAVLFEREGACGAVGLLDEVQHRFRSTGSEDIFLKTVGDGTLWIALLMSLAELPHEGYLGALRRALALRAVHNRRTLIAAGTAGRMRSLVKRLDERRARGLLEEAPHAVAAIEHLESHLASREGAVRATQSVATFLHRPGDLLWTSGVGWAECREETSDHGNGRIFSHRLAREMTVRMSTYVNATQASKSDPELAGLIQALLGGVDPQRKPLAASSR